MNKINFFNEGLEFDVKGKQKIRKWVTNTISEEGFLKVSELNFIFCSDNYLLDINQKYLNHDTYTDIVTFDSSENNDEIAGDIFISIDRVNENAEKFKVDLKDELHRVIIHGVLHLCGYKDKTKEEKNKMTQKENQYLGLRSAIDL